MKTSKSQIHSNVHKIPELRFEDQRLTSYSGIVIFQALLQKLELSKHLRECFEHRPERLIVGFGTVVRILIFHLILGHRRLRDIELYKDDPMVLRALSLKRMPNVSTICRTLSRMDRYGIENVRLLSQEIVLQRLEKQKVRRLTLDFDGSVISTGRYAEGSAVGFNKEKKGARSYYPLFCTVSQTSQVLDALHRSGNVHDSQQSVQFMQRCIQAVRKRLPGVIVESRKDSAFFSDEIVDFLDSQGVEFTISVPFERFTELKSMIERRERWKALDNDWSYFETGWSPKCWSKDYRFLFLRHRVRKLNKEPVQLELFTPQEFGYEFKLIVTNKSGQARNILLFHNGRGSQENIFSELKTQCNMDYVPSRYLVGNQIYYLSAILSHNLYHELQMESRNSDRTTTVKRASLWMFDEAASIRRRIIQRAGKITFPQGRLRLTMSANEATKRSILHYLERFLHAA